MAWIAFCDDTARVDKMLSYTVLGQKEDIPWWDSPRTWPLAARLTFGAVLLVGVFGIIRYTTKTG